MLKCLISDLGNVILFFDHMITAKSLSKIIDLQHEEIYKRIESSGIHKDYVIGKLSDQEFYESVLKVLDVSTSMLSFVEFAECWGNIFHPNQPMIDFLIQIKSRIRIILLSNTNSLHIKYIEKHFPDVIDLFEGRLVYSHEVGAQKPDRIIYEHALELAECKPEECLFVDDISEYVIAARDSGIIGHVYTSHEKFLETINSML